MSIKSKIDHLDKRVRSYLKTAMIHNQKETVAFLLNKEFDMSYQEIADLMGSSRGTVGSQIHKANIKFVDFVTENNINCPF